MHPVLDEIEDLQLLHLYAENVKRLRVVDIRFDREKGVFSLCGNNAQGKTSVIDAIVYALAGKRSLPDNPVRNGEDRLKIELDLGDLTVERTIMVDGRDSLVVKYKDTKVKSSPQTLLDALYSKVAFDPLEFARMEAVKRLELLRKLVGVVFDDIEEARREIYDRRTIVNREVERLDAKMVGRKVDPKLPKEAPSTEELLLRLQQAEESIRGKDRMVAEKARANNDVAELARSIAKLEQQLEAAKAKLEIEKGKVASAEKMLADCVTVDPEPVRAQIRQIGDMTTAIANNNALIRQQVEHREKKAEAEDLTVQIGRLDDEKRRRVAEAKFPIPDLSFGENDVLYRGQPFNQAAESERIRTSAAIGFALHPKLKLGLIRDASLLDDAGMLEMVKIARDHKGLIIAERVGQGLDGWCSVVIEDGAVKEV